MKPIDLRSDTVTKPCPGMRQAMANAEVGDDVLGDDPTIIKLEEKIAGMLEKEAAVFVPSGTMANQVAIWLQTRRGDSIAVEEDAHIFHYEAAGPAVLSSVLIRPIQGHRGIMNVDALKKAIPPEDPHFAPVSLICVEDTANKGGGSVYPLETLDEIGEFAAEIGAKAHLDGARLFNAAIASGHSAARRAKGYETVSICFSKGLGAPVGSAICIPKDRVKEAKRARKAMGGGMRQSGVLAAAALYALEHNLPKLEADHLKIKRLAGALSNAGLAVRPPESNMVYFEHEKAPELVELARQAGVWCLATGPTTIRLVCHLDISSKEVDTAIAVFQRLLGEI